MSEATENVTAEDLALLTVAERIGFAAAGLLRHLEGDPGLQLTRADLKGLSADQIVAARRAGMLTAIGG